MDDKDNNDATASETPLQVLRSEIEAEESAAFLNAKKDEGSESEESVDLHESKEEESNEEAVLYTEAKTSESVTDKDVSNS